MHGAGVLFKGARGRCGQPRVPTHTYSMHGGAGAILSVGLLRRIPLGWFEDCVTTTYSTGGDAFISICLWAVSLLISLCTISPCKPGTRFISTVDTIRWVLVTLILQASWKAFAA